MSAESTSAVEISLAADFVTPSLADWEKEVLKVLNRRHPEDKELNIGQAYKHLTNRTVDGLVIKSLYTIDDGVRELGFPGVAPFTHGTTVRAGEMNEGWFNAQFIEEPDPAEAHKAVDTDLKRDTSAAQVRVDPDAVPADKLAEVLSGVLFGLAPIHVPSSIDKLAATEALTAAFAASGKENVHDSLNTNPVGFATPSGTTPDLSMITGAVRLAKPFSGVCPIVIDASRYDSMGAGDVAQLVYTLATGTEHVRVPTDLRLSADEAFDSILFRVSVNTNQFVTTPRLRALRTLWNRVGEVLGVSPGKHGAVQYVVASLREITRGGAYVNVLRGTISAPAAVASRAEFITVLPLGTVIGLPDVLTHHIARNTQVVLAEGSNIGCVNNPASGVWFVESMTKQFCEKTWELFGQFDEKGMAATIADDTVAAQPKEINKARARLLATHKLPLTGVPIFPNHLEKALERTPHPAAPKLDGIPFVRDSQVFGDLRDCSKTVKKTSTVLLACLGTQRDLGGCEGFTSNLYHVDGINTVIMEGTNPEMFVKAMQEVGTDITVLCSSAKVYAAHGLTVAKVLEEAGAQEMRLAGQLKELGGDEAGASAVIDGNVFDGMNVVESPTSTLDKLEA